MNQWFENDKYIYEKPLLNLESHAYENGVATVAVYANGKSQPGWGESDFVRNYKLGKFNAMDRTDTYAYVMRSLPMLVIDIDGKNDGVEHAKLLNLPPTLAETSKSGNGYHLWYLMNDSWDDEKGYAGLSDRLALVQGVDVRVTGCVFHYPQQRWNNRALAVAPRHLISRIEARENMHTTPAQIKALQAAGDEVEIKRLISEASESLARPIPDGRRNQTLFAIGSQLYLLGYADWATAIENRGISLGLDQAEIDKLIRNIPNYAERA